ncbi:MAG TPA: DUF1206 domain-containing protein [Tepidisphaeraceae bacterium]|jgi:hypothetical protein
MARAHQSDFKRDVNRAVRKAGPYIEKIARFGIASKGITYLILGGIAVLAAVGAGHKTASTGGMLQLLIGRPLGWTVFTILALGFLAFGIWQWLRAFRDPEFEGSDWKGLRKRFAYFWAGLVNFVLVGVAIRILMIGPNRDVSGDRKAQNWAATALHYPLGRWALAGVGIGMVIYGGACAYRAWKMESDDELPVSELSESARNFACWMGKFGITARGLVFALIGVFLVLAGWHQSPGEAKGQGGVLTELEHHQYGTIMLSVVAAGLIAYGLYALVLAWYRRIRTR